MVNNCLHLKNRILIDYEAFEKSQFEWEFLKKANNVNGENK